MAGAVVAHCFGRRSLAGGFSLICAWSMVDFVGKVSAIWNNQPS